MSFELREARVSAGEAARYVECNDTDAFAAATSALLDDPSERAWRGRVGRDRLASTLSWDHSKLQLLASYAATMGAGAPQPSSAPVVGLPAQQDAVAADLSPAPREAA